ncbi:torsin-like protein [Drosophila subpulchrella]|uniref:torsin-like protein n=1 Tax=Drosophila subpulchrella TaxID=1486046 RepID=UPI0018A18566|nr:torsin-like protein [Drosophila subpulchrella]
MGFLSLLPLCLGLLAILPRPLESLEPLTMGAIGFGALGLGTYFKEHTYCRFTECCDDRSIPADTGSLAVQLHGKLIGQHIATQHILPAIMAHVGKRSNSRKPLVMSFHGQPGTGKNFVADLIADALYLEGSKSSYVAKYLGQADFPQAEHVGQYKMRINREVRDHLRNCPRSLFIFDEVDKMPPGVFDTLASLVDYNAFADGTDNTKSIFIFLSNTAGSHIADHLGNLMKGGKLREDTRLSDFEPLLRKAAYNLDGGLKKTTMIEAHVIDHYIPFLPMEKAHVVNCLEVEFGRWGKDPNRKIIDEIMASSISYDRTHGLFAISGCKTLEKKVAMAIN